MQDGEVTPRTHLTQKLSIHRNDYWMFLKALKTIRFLYNWKSFEKKHKINDK